METIEQDTPACTEQGAHVEMDLSSPAFVSNPYPTYRRLLQDFPVYFSAEKRAYYVSRHADVRRLLRDPRLSSDRISAIVSQLPGPVAESLNPLVSSLSAWVIFQDPPQHGRVRKVLNRAFATGVVHDLEPQIRELTRFLVERVQPTGEMDVVRDLAYPLPVLVISRMLGVPDQDRERIKQWSDAIAQFLGGELSIAQASATQTALLEMQAYITELVASHRSCPQGDLLDELIRDLSEEDGFSEADLVANCVALLFAGHETTTNLIANTWLSLMNHPGELRRLQQQPELMNGAVEEGLRFESPVQRLARVIKEPVEVAGETLQPGNRVFLLIAAANRDPDAFAHPDDFEISRDARGHCAFGHGTHLCSGAALARMEASIALDALVSRFPHPVALHAMPNWIHNIGLRAMESFPMTFDAGVTG